MRPHGAAAVFVRVDQWRQRNRALDRGIEPDAEFADEIQIGAEAGRHDQFVDDHLTSATTVAGPDEEARAVGGQMRDTEFAFHRYLARCDQCREGCAQRAAGGKLVVGAAAKSLGRITAA